MEIVTDRGEWNENEIIDIVWPVYLLDNEVKHLRIFFITI